jgi:hypothetical protein
LKGKRLAEKGYITGEGKSNVKGHPPTEVVTDREWIMNMSTCSK